MDINPRASLVARKEIFIQASPDAVWEVLTTINTWNQWQPGVSIAKLEGSLAVGSIFRWKAGYFSIVSTLQVIEPNKRISWTGVAFGIRSRHIWTFSPCENGTLVITEESLEGWSAQLTKIMTPNFLEGTLGTMLNALKRRVEGGGNNV